MRGVALKRIALACTAAFALAVAAAFVWARVSGNDVREREGAGFLPTATVTPRAPGAVQGFYGWCPDLPRTACLQLGETFNPYRDLSLDHVVEIQARQVKAPSKWVLDPAKIAEILTVLDADVQVVAARSIPVGEEARALTLEFKWAAGYGAFGTSHGRLDLDADGARRRVGFGFIAWDAPPEFFERLTTYLADASPTPEPSPTATPEIAPAGAVFFDYPDEDLEWPGPDGPVRSHADGHCGRAEVRAAFGIPSLITIGERMGFWLMGATQRDPSWRWTGHAYREWEIWQGDDPLRIYLVKRDEQRIAFEYLSYGCI